MSGFRAYFDFKGTPSANTVTLSPNESRHLIGARRAKLGALVDLFDLEGNAFSAKILEANPKKCVLEILGKIDIIPAPHKIMLGQAIPKSKTFDDILRQSIEIGIDGVYPILSENCEVKIAPKDAPDKKEKWQVQIIEAMKQSSNLAKFDFPLADKFESFLEYTKNFDLKIIASLEADTKPILTCLSENKNASSVAILIGPEGDFSPREYLQAKEAGFKPVTLGKQVMKAETASLCAASVVSNFFLASQNSCESYC